VKHEGVFSKTDEHGGLATASLGNSRPGTERNPQASSACAYIIIIGTARDASESIMSEWSYAHNSAAGSLWGAPNHCWLDTLQRKNYRWSFPRRQKWKNIFVDYFRISGYNKNIKNNM
jgi:hypothetical protein